MMNQQSIGSIKSPTSLKMWPEKRNFISQPAVPHSKITFNQPIKFVPEQQRRQVDELKAVVNFSNPINVENLKRENEYNEQE